MFHVIVILQISPVLWSPTVLIDCKLNTSFMCTCCLDKFSIMSTALFPLDQQQSQVELNNLLHFITDLIDEFILSSLALPWCYVTVN